MKFLEKVANDIYKKFGGKLENVTIVFPSKRASLFFNRHLAEIAKLPTWSPEYITLSELYQRLSDLTVADPLLLIYHLYAAYSEVVNKTRAKNDVTEVSESSQPGAVNDVNKQALDVQPLDQFYSWGEVMLNDFDDIDKNMTHAKDIFTNLKELDDLSGYDYLSESQIEAIQRYFGAFDKDDKTKLKEKFLTIWNLLYPIYETFRSRLLSHGLAYEGMLCRDIVERGFNPDGFNERIFVFVGFNVLTATDHRLFTYLKQEGKALFYWDYDKSYVDMSDDSQYFFEAGRFIKQNIAQFGNSLSADSSCYDEMHSSKQITYVSSPTDNSQTRYAHKWLSEHITQPRDPNETAVVLCNGNLLQSMLHSIPKAKEGDEPYKINVTMGFPMSQTPICSFIQALMDLQIYGERGNGYWNYTYVVNILHHPYANILSSNKALEILNTIKKKNIFFVSTEQFKEDDILSFIFTKQCSNNDMLVYLSEITQRIGIALFNNKETEKRRREEKDGRNKTYYDDDTVDFDLQLYQESIFNAFTLINRLRSIREIIFTDNDFLCIRSADMEPVRLISLIRQLLQGISIPFHGEPAEGIQIISMLDTRNLDFNNVLILGANDENIPLNVHQSSFIPYTLREAHGMTTMEARSSLYAYSFYRLLQRADNISIMYNNTIDETSKGIMSRYMTQLLIEQEKLFSNDTRISIKSLESKVEQQNIKTFEVKKNAEVLKKLKEKFNILDDNGNITDDDHRKYFSPSALNKYLSCPLQFYLHYVAGLKEEDEITEEVGDSVFGTIFHYCMENIYKSHRGKTLTTETLTAWGRDTEKIEKLVDEGFRKEFFHLSDGRSLLYNGEQWLNREVIVKYVKKQLKYDSQLCPLVIEDVENKSHDMTIKVGDVMVRLGGIIDRIDTIHVGDPEHERHRIVDYKTSGSAQTFKSLDDLFNKAKDKRPYHIFQTFYYSDIYTEKCSKAVSPSLMYIKPANSDIDKDKEEESIVKYGKEPIVDFASQMKGDFHEQLMLLLTEIFDNDVPFTQAENEHSCTYCAFKDFCGR